MKLCHPEGINLCLLATWQWRTFIVEETVGWSRLEQFSVFSTFNSNERAKAIAANELKEGGNCSDGRPTFHLVLQDGSRMAFQNGWWARDQQPSMNYIFRVAQRTNKIDRKRERRRTRDQEKMSWLSAIPRSKLSRPCSKRRCWVKGLVSTPRNIATLDSLPRVFRIRKDIPLLARH